VNSSIHVVVVEDKESERSGLTIPRRIYDDLLLAVVAHSQSEALELCALAQPDIILLELPDPERDGAEVSRAIAASYPYIRVVVLAAPKPAGQDVALAVATPPPLPAGSLSPAGPAPECAPAKHLTSREHEVLGLMAEGLTNAQIAGHLCISRATVKFHVSSILSKLRSPTRTAAVAVAMQRHMAVRSAAIA